MNDRRRDHELNRLLERYHDNRESRIFAPLADQYRKQGDLDEALRVCRRGISLHPEYSSAHVILAKIHLDRGETGEAELAFDRVLDLDPENLLALQHLAELAEADDRPEVAHEYWIRLLELDPAHELAAQRIELSESLSHETYNVDTVDAPAEDEPAEPEIEPESVLPDAAAAVEHSRDLDESEEEDADPAESAAGIATSTLADIYYQQGFKTKALGLYRQLREERPDDAMIQAKVDRIETELAEIESNLEPQDMDLLEDSSEGVLSARFVDEAPSAAAKKKPVAPPRDEDFANFRTWLDQNRVKP